MAESNSAFGSHHVNFSESTEGAPHVHFPDEQMRAHDSEIVVQQSGDSRIDVHLGFLQIHHRYHVKFSIKDRLGEDVTADPLQNLNVKLMEAIPTEDGEGHDLLLDFKAYKEKLLQEHLIITDASNALKTVTLVLHARSLGKGKGTPALRRGIHCVGVDIDEESEQSDWQGFD